MEWSVRSIPSRYHTLTPSLSPHTITTVTHLAPILSANVSASFPGFTALIAYSTISSYCTAIKQVETPGNEVTVTPLLWPLSVSVSLSLFQPYLVCSSRDRLYFRLLSYLLVPLPSSPCAPPPSSPSPPPHRRLLVPVRPAVVRWGSWNCLLQGLL